LGHGLSAVHQLGVEGVWTEVLELTGEDDSSAILESKFSIGQFEVFLVERVDKSKRATVQGEEVRYAE